MTKTRRQKRDQCWLRGVALAGIATVSIAFTACGDDAEDGASNAAADAPISIPATPESGTFNMSLQPWIGWGPWFIADEKGYFKDEGVSVKITSFGENAQHNAAVQKGEFEGSNLPTNIALRLMASGVPLKIVLLESQSTKADAILAGPGIDSIEDLKGKKVAFEEGSTPDELLRYALKQAGMSIDDIEKVPTTSSAAGSALIAGRVDAAATYEPYITTAMDNGDDITTLYTAEQAPGLITDVFAVKEDVVKNKPGQLAALMCAWQASVEHYESDPESGKTIMADALGVPPADLATSFAGVEIYGLEDALKLMQGEFVEQANMIQDSSIEAGHQPERVDVEQAIDTRFVEAALEGC